MEESLSAAALGANAYRAKVVAVAQSPEGDRAIVLVRFDNGHELYRFCVRAEAGWTLAEGDPAASAGRNFHYVGGSYVWCTSGLMPLGKNAAIVRRGAEQHRVEATGDFVVAWWDLPEAASQEPPEVVRFE
jgi:hypothetical protein